MRELASSGGVAPCRRSGGSARRETRGLGQQLHAGGQEALPLRRETRRLGQQPHAEGQEALPLEALPLRRETRRLGKQFAETLRVSMLPACCLALSLSAFGA